jgi:DNA-binding NtrC family response regulator
VLGTQDLLDHPASLEATAASLTPAGQAQSVETLRQILVGRTIADVERHLILDTLVACLGNRTHAARILGISIRTLRNKLNEYMQAGIAVPEPGHRPA